MYDQAHLTMPCADRPEQALVQADVGEPRTAVWELTMYAASTIGVRVWLLAMQHNTPVHVSPFWGGPGPASWWSSPPETHRCISRSWPAPRHLRPEPPGVLISLRPTALALR
ncbi:hypothetical protein [Streptomyces arboris]|uniref:hypothetical protein n=1 Tax=Streptomyces arboris TaxID=2600619 RepID=UPI0036397D16